VLRGVWKSHLREFDTYISKFRAHSKRVEKEAGLAHMIESARIRDVEMQNRALQLRNAKYEKRNRILASLPAIDYISKQSKLANSKHPGTCEWLRTTPELESWYAQPSSNCICCYGIPGSGKSVLAASIRDFLEDSASTSNKNLVCYHYCDYSDKPSLSMIHVIGSLIKQILEHLNLDQFGEDFKCPYRDDRDTPTHDEGSRYLQDLLDNFERTYFILDGIDELDATNQKHLLALIDLLMNRTRQMVKVFVTSRTEEFRVKESLKQYPSVHLSSKHVDDDIAMFIKDEIRQISAPHPLTFDSELKDEVVQKLVKGAKGM
jgi:Cdc6-like AAA superfamily ATPase